MKKNYKLLFLALWLCLPYFAKAQSYHPYANPDSATTQMDQTVFILVAFNDNYNPPTNAINYGPGPYVLCDYPYPYGSLQSLNGGTVAFWGDSLAVYTPPLGFTGTDYFYYAVCSANSTYQLDTALVTVHVINCNPLGTIGNLNGQQSTFCQGSVGYFSIGPVSGASLYSWSVPPGSNVSSNGTTAVVHFGSNSSSGHITVTAFNNCGQSISSQPFSISVIPNTLNISANVTHSSSPSSCDGEATINVTGGTAPYSYMWPIGYTMPHATFLCPGVYGVWVTDANGCTDSINVVIHHLGLTATATIVDPSCGQCNGSASAIVSGGTGPFIYHWTPTGHTTQTIQVCDNGFPETHTVTVTDANNHSVTASVTAHAYCDSVWPGDTDLDSIVTMQDLFPIGIAYGLSGPVRPNASLNWIGQAAPDWATSTNSINNKNVDTNGDGIINLDDTLAVINNLGLTRSSASGASGSGPLLTLEMPDGPLGLEQSIAIPVKLGLASAQANGVYAITFRLQWDPSLVSPGSVSFDASSGWIGTPGTDAFTVTRYLDGMADIAIVRTNQAEESGYGEIGVLYLETASELTNGLSQQFSIDFANVHMINVSGTELDVNSLPASSEVSIVGIAGQIGSQGFRIYPNPSGASVFVDNRDGAIIEYVHIYNSLGQLCFSQQTNSKGSAIKIEHGLRPGVYQLAIKTPSGQVIKPLVVIDRH